MSRREQLALKPAKKEKGGRGRGRGGGRGAGRGAKSKDKEHAEERKENNDQCDWNFTEEEVWEEYYAWRNQIYEEERKTKKKAKASKVESHEKSKGKGEKRKHRASSGFYDTSDDDDVEPAGKPTRSSSANQTKVGDQHANDLNEEIIASIMSFVAQIDYASLELDDLKAQVRAVLPKFNFSALTIYWTRSACGVKTDWRSEHSDIANFSFGKQFQGTPSCKTIVAIGFGFHMVPQIMLVND